MERVKRGQLNKILALMVVFAMLILVVPVTASADTADTYEVFDESYESDLSFEHDDEHINDDFSWETEFIWDDNDLLDYTNIEASYIGIVPASGVMPARVVNAGWGWSPSSGVVPGTTFTWVGRNHNGPMPVRMGGPNVAWESGMIGWQAGWQTGGTLANMPTPPTELHWHNRPGGFHVTPAAPTVTNPSGIIWRFWGHVPVGWWIDGGPQVPEQFQGVQIMLPMANGSITTVQPPQATPLPPTMVSRTTNSITLTAVGNSTVSGVTWINQFRHRPQGGTWGNWTTTNVRTGLTSGVMYEFQRRWVAGANTGGNNASYHSNESNAAQFRAVPAAPTAPTMTNRSTNSINISAAPSAITQFTVVRERRWDVGQTGTWDSGWTAFTGNSITGIPEHANGTIVEVRQRHHNGASGFTMASAGANSTVNVNNGTFRTVPITPTPTAQALAANSITVAALPVRSQFTVAQEWRLYPAGTFAAVPANRVIDVPAGTSIEVRQRYVPGPAPFAVGPASEWAYATLMFTPPKFEIWNWADLAMVLEMQWYGYTEFVVMQDIGIPGLSATFGDGSATVQNGNVQSPYFGDGSNRQYGWFGYQGFEGGTFDIAYEGYGHGWTGDSGWLPIGHFCDGYGSLSWDRFNGNFNGQGFEISGLWINRLDDAKVGLFSYTYGATISNLGVHIREGKVVAGGELVGGFVGLSDNSTFTNCFVTGNVFFSGFAPNATWASTRGWGGGFAGAAMDGRSTFENCFADVNIEGCAFTGGFIGYSFDATFINSHATGDVTGNYGAGGFIGGAEYGIAEFIDSSAAGDVTGVQYVGGFVGIAQGVEVTNSHAEGDVTGARSVGGFVGYAYVSTFSNSSATGDVTGEFYDGWGVFGAGGFAGEIENSEVINSHAEGNVVGVWSVGGFVGAVAICVITDSHAIGNVIGENSVGGFIGVMGSGEVTNSHAEGDVTGVWNVGGFGGEISDVEVTNSHAIGDVTGEDSVGGFIGMAFSVEIEDCHAEGDVNSDVTGYFRRIGGFVGIVEGNSTITDSHAFGEVTGERYVGGFAGAIHNSEVTDSSAAGEVTGTNNYTGTTGTTPVGGFVGYINNGEVTDSHATGDIIGYAEMGGFVGIMNNNSTITDSHATGDLTGQLSVGGFVGTMNNNSTIKNSHATGDVTSIGANSGGFAGQIWNSEITGSSAAGVVTGDLIVGGFVGATDLYAIITNSHATGDVEGINVGGQPSELIGGFVGFLVMSEVTNSHATGNVTGCAHVGGFVGWQNYSDVTNSHATGDVISTHNYAGGFVGTATSMSTFTDSYATGDVTGDDYVGGFVGRSSESTFIDCSATGNVICVYAFSFGTSTAGGFVGIATNSIFEDCFATGNVENAETAGGFVGEAFNSTITGSFATGDISGQHRAGGFIGVINNSEVTNSFATGNVSGDYEVGGFVGAMDNNSTITNSFAVGNVTAILASAGGFVGRSNDGEITNSYATGNVIGVNNVGGFVGETLLNSIITNSYATGKVTGDSGTGGFVGAIQGGTFTNNHFDEERTGMTDAAGSAPGAIAGITAQTTDHMTSAAFAATLGGAFVYRTEESGEFRGRRGNITPGINDDWAFYPQLTVFAPVGGELADLYIGTDWNIRNRWSIISVIVFDEPDGASISGRVLYDGWNPDDIKPARVRLYDASNNVVATVYAYINVNNGAWEFTNVPSGTYRVVAHKMNHTRFTIFNIAVTDVDIVIQDTLMLFAGNMDAINDEEINTLDWSLLVNSMFQTHAQALEQDLNDDNQINVLDQSLLLNNFLQTSRMIDWTTLP